MKNTFNRRIICIGNGLAALNLAMNTAPDTEVFILSSTDTGVCNSMMAKGGIAIPLHTHDIELHVADTLNAGAGLCDPQAVEDIVSEAPGMFDRFLSRGLRFDPHFALEGGHRRSRVRHIADETGRFIMEHLGNLTQGLPNVRMLNHHQALDLLTENGVCYGAVFADTVNNRVFEMHADAVVIASGGCAGLYLNHTNARTSNGEGIAIAKRAGAEIKDMEFIQFHPTTLYDPGTEAHCNLITEAFRGAGAHLIDEQNNRIMDPVHPMGSLAPRDIVSRTMYRHMIDERKTHLWLDYTEVKTEEMDTHFPALKKLFSITGTGDRRVPVVPAAHYQCGGICTNTQGETGVKNLYAVGEVARTGLHGANRLASNSLMELLVVSERIACRINETEGTNPHKVHTWKAVSALSQDELTLADSELKHVLWESFGIIRNRKGMQEGLSKLSAFESELRSLLSEKPDSVQARIRMNRVETATILATQAAERSESRGCHFLEEELVLEGRSEQAEPILI